MKIEISKCDSSCPFYITDIDYDYVGHDTIIHCHIIRFLKLNTEWNDDSIACFDSRDLDEPIEMCDYCKELERQAEETDIWEEKDESKCSCIYTDVEFIHPKKCPLLNEDITIIFKKDL